MLHKKELVLNRDQTADMLRAVSITDRIVQALGVNNNSNSIINNANKTNNKSVYIEKIEYHSDGKQSGKQEGEDFAKALINTLNKK